MRSLLRQCAAALAAAFFVSASLPQTALAQAAVTATKSDGVPAATRVLPGSTVTYTNTINSTGASAASGVTFTDPNVAGTTMVPGSVHISPLASNDSYQTLANTNLNVDEPGGPAVQITTTVKLQANDRTLNAPGGTDTTTIVSHTAPTNGTILSFDNSDGSFAYVPNAGYVGTDTFTYTVQNNADVTLTDTATVTITVLDTNPVVGGNQKIWYVQNNATAGGLGRSQDPFDTLAEAETASAAGDTIYVFTGSGTTGQSAGIVLKDSQRLLGAGVALAVPVSLTQQGGAAGPNPTSLASAGSAPSISNGAGSGVSVANLTNVEIRGLNISSTAGNGIVVNNTAVTGGSFEVANNTITGASQNGLDVNVTGSGALNASIHDNTITAAGNGIDINNTAGTCFITAFDDNFVTGNTGGIGVTVFAAIFDAVPGGNLDTVFCGTTVIGTSGDGVGTHGFVLSVVSGDISFSDLDIVASAGSGFNVTGSGAFNITSGARVTITSAGAATVAATGGPAVYANNVTLNTPFGVINSINSASTGVTLTSINDGTTASIFTAAAGSSITNATGTDFVCDSNNADVTYNGTITDDVGSLVTMGSNTSGTKSFTGAITDGNDGDGSGISLNSNTGATISFSGGLTLATGNNPAFTATGGGTVNVTQNNTSIVNTIATTTGTALNIANTTIGASGVTFRSISSNGASSGIVLNTTGSTGGLTVTGNSSGLGGGQVTVNAVGTAATVTAPNTADLTGGTIQNSTGAGISLTNTMNVSLTRVRVLNSGTDGILVSTINGFSLNSCFISDSTGGAGDRGIEMGDFATGTAVNGAISIVNSTVGPTPHDNFGVGIASGTSTWNITGTVFDDSQLNSGFNFEIRNATVTSFMMDGCVLRSQFADGMQMQPASGVNATLASTTIQNTSFLSNNIGMDLNHDGTGTSTYKVLANTFLSQTANSINFFSSSVQAPTTGGTFNGRFVGNRIGSDSIANSGGGIGLRINVNGGAAGRVLVDSNVVRQVLNGRGIEIISRNGTGGLDATVTSNNVSAPINTLGPFAQLAAIFLQSNSVTVPNTLRADVRSNVVPSTTVDGEFVDAHLQVVRSGTSTNQLVDNAPASASAAAELASQNTGSTNTAGTVTLIAGPLNTPPALLFAPAEVESFSAGEPDSVERAIAWTETVRKSMNRGQPSVARASESITGGPPVANPAQEAPATSVPLSASALTQAELDVVVSASRALWEASGLTAQQKTLLNNLTFEVTDLPGWYLGENNDTLIRVDSDAGGNGWFVDTTPADNSEFSSAGLSVLRSRPSAPVSDRIDLLTTVLHEMGHSLGLCDTYSKLQRSSVMYGFLTKGERRLPAQGQAIGAVPHEHATPHHLAAPLIIGNLPPGKSVTIKYAVVVTDPPLSGSLTSQATVSGDNFTSVLTDDSVTNGDPPLAGAADPTVTQVDLPDVSVTIGAPTSQLENSGSPLTYTFTRAGVTTTALTVNFSITGTASASDFTFAGPIGSTFSAGSGTLILGIGTSSASITLTPSGDTTVEPDETIIVSVASGALYDIGIPAAATGTITNDDADIAVTVAPASVTENGGSALTYTLTRTGYTAIAVTANFTVGGTATLGGSAPANDFTTAGFSGSTGSVDFAISDTVKTITVTPVGDTIDENDETVVLTMATGTGYNVSGSAATGTITDDDLPPTVSIAAPSPVTEGNAGTTTLSFPVSLTSASAKTITVNYATANGTASFASSDYDATSGTLTFAPGDVTKTVNVTVNGDTLNEANETLTVTLSGPANATLGTTVATGTINNDDPVPTLAINDVTLAEGNAGTTAFTFTVTLSPASGQTATVNYATADGTALAASDYAATSGTLTFAPGDLTKTVTVLVTGDTTSEGSENFFVNLTGPTNASIADSQGLGTITDDDLPQVSVATLAVGDNDAAEGGSNNGLFTFTRNSTVGALTASFQLDVSSTAIAGTDFTLTGATTFDNATGAGTIAFADTVGTATVTLTALTESPNAAEAAETARLNIVASPGVYFIGASPNATVTIAANSFIVTTTADSGTGSLRQAALNANGIAGTDIITFAGTTFTDGTVPDVISLSGGEVSLDSNVTIQGLGANVLTVQNTAVAGVSSRVFRVTASATGVVLRGMTITGGNTTSGAGGLLVESNANAAVVGCSISGNTTTSYGGGMRSLAGATLAVVNSTIANNTANSTSTGGAMDANGTVSFINTTISGNSATAGGAGALFIYNCNATLTNVTITNNTSSSSGTGGVSQLGSGTTTVSNSIIAGNVNNATVPDISNSFISGGGNIIGNAGTAVGFTHGVNSDQVGTGAVPVNPLLGPLQNNGGPTSTHALLVGSPALNAGLAAKLPVDIYDADGDNNFAETLDVDQRGATFTRAIGAVDIGAFELQKSVSILADAASKAEGNSGTTNFTFTISRSGGTVGAVAMTYTVSGAAVNGTDFVGGTLPTGTATIAAGSASTIVTIPISGDTLVEPDEAFTVTLSSPDNGYVITGAPASSSITNDDSATVTLAKTADGTEGSANATFRLTQTAPSSTDTVVNIAATGASTATSGTDYTALGSTATILAGQTTADVTVTVTDDRLVEGAETVIATLGSLGAHNTGVTLGATVTDTAGIADNDTATLGFTLGTSSTSEGQVATVGTTLSLNTAGSGTPGLASNLTANLTAASGGNATGGGTDYTLPGNPALTFLAGTYPTGTGTQNASVTIVDDRLGEGGETANLGLSIVTNIGTQVSVGGTTAHALQITDNELISLAYSSATGTALEDAGTQNVAVVLTIDAFGSVGTTGLAMDVSANLGTSGGTATATGTDYTLPGSPAVTFTAGAYASGTATQNAAVLITDDRLVEGAETAALTLNPVAIPNTALLTPGPSTHTLTITDNDTATLGFTLGSSTALENAGVQSVGTTLTITSNGSGNIGLASNLTANFTATGGTVSASDYTLPASPALTYLAGPYLSGTATQNASVTIVNDSIVETSETLDLGLSIVTNIGSQASLGGTTAHTLTITDNDTATVTLTPASLSVNEGTGGGPTLFTFTGTADSAVQGGFTVAYTTADGTATAGSDYTATSGTLTFAGTAGESQTITVPVAHDATNELDETFTVSLGAFSGTTLGSSLSTAQSPATATILNDDLLTLSISATDASADENTAGTGTWRITRNGSVGSTTVQLQIDATSTALAADWSQTGATFASLVPGSSGTAVIPDGSSFVDITLTPLADVHAEADETAILKITTDAAYTIGTSPATVTIGANDFVVINASNTGEGTLRQAVLNANVFASDDVITFASAQNVVLTSGELVVQNNGTLTILGGGVTSISGNLTSRVFNVSASAHLTLRGLWIKDGSSANGGAIYNDGTVNIISSTLSGNTATGAGSTGGAIYNTFYVTVVNSTLSGNTSGGAGGAISNNAGNVTVTNSTVSGNNAGGNGGGLHSNNGNMSVYNSTVTANATSNGDGGGVYSGNGNLDLFNSILAGNTATTGSHDLFTTAITDRNNLIGVNTGHPLTTGTRGNLVGTAATPFDALLGPLANNGGPTLTHALQDGSPAINAGLTTAIASDDFDVDGNSNSTDPLAVDQRGAGFARVIGSVVDIGSYEAFAFRPAITAATFNEDTQNISGLVVTPNTADGGQTTAFKITNIQNGVLYKSNGTTAITSGSFITLVEGAAGLKFTPSLNLNSPTTTFGFDAQATVGGADTGLRSGIATASITITPVNDAPTVISPGLADQTILVTATRSIPLSPAFTDLDGDTLTFSVQTNSIPAKASAVINGANVDIQGIAAGNTNITILANDSHGGTVTDTFLISVGTPEPTPGVIVPPAGGYVVSQSTGTLNLTVPITNTTSAPVNGFRVTVDLSAYQAQYPGLRLANCSSAPGVTPAFIDYPYPVAVGAGVSFRLDFYAPGRVYPNPLNPVVTITTLAVSQPAAAVGNGVPATIRRTTAGEIVLEWNSTPGAWYRVQFSNDMVSWYTSTIPIQAFANRTLWYDSGAPFTIAPPVGSRFYRVTAGPAPTP